MPPKLITKDYFPTTMTIDGVELVVRVTRMSNAVYDEFAIGLALWGNPRGSAPATLEEAAAANATTRVWLQDVLHRFFQIEAGQFEHKGQDVTDGAMLIDIYGGRVDVVPQALALINGENTLTEAQKKSYRLRLVSLLGSENELLLTDTGPAPDSIAAPVSERASALDADATADSNERSSGTTAP